MTFVITDACIGTKDRSCVDVCPVDCIHDDGDEDPQLYIDPDECIDCGACEPACPVTAIFSQDDVPDNLKAFIEVNSIWYKDKVKQSSSSKDTHHLYFKPIGSVFKEVIGNKLIDTTGYKVIDQETVAAVAQGNFTGDRAVSVHVSTTQSASTGGATKRSADGGDVVASTDEPRSSTKFK